MRLFVTRAITEWMSRSGPPPLARFRADDSGATLVEFLLGIPVFIVIFVGILHLGHINMESVRIWSLAHSDTFNRLADTAVMEPSELISDQSSGRGDREGSVLLPASAAASAMTQLVETPPNIENRFMRAAVVAADGMVFSGGPNGSLPVNGHFGEISARTMVISPFKTLSPVDEAISPTPGQYFGAPREGSVLGRSLLYDQPSLAGFGSISNCEGANNSVMTYATNAANGLLTGFGVRPALAASMQYGTYTGTSTDVITYGRISTEVNAYFNVGITPHTLDPVWIQPFLTMFISRLALEDCNLQPYSGLLGIQEAVQTLPQNVDALAIDDGVPTPDDAGLVYPLNYD